MKGCIEESTRNLEKVVKVLDESQQRYVEEIEMVILLLLGRKRVAS